MEHVEEWTYEAQHNAARTSTIISQHLLLQEVARLRHPLGILYLQLLGGMGVVVVRVVSGCLFACGFF